MGELFCMSQMNASTILLKYPSVTPIFPHPQYHAKCKKDLALFGMEEICEGCVHYSSQLRYRLNYLKREDREAYSVTKKFLSKLGEQLEFPLHKINAAIDELILFTYTGSEEDLSFSE